MILGLRFITRQVYSLDGTTFENRKILQQKVQVWGSDSDRYGNVYGTCVIGEEWQDVPMQDNP